MCSNCGLCGTCVTSLPYGAKWGAVIMDLGSISTITVEAHYRLVPCHRGMVMYMFMFMHI